MMKSAAVATCLLALLGRTLAGDGGGDGSDGSDGSDSGAECDTAWAKISGGGNCFRDEPELNVNRWGWNNKIANVDGTTTLELWAGAGKCDLSKGWEAGSVVVVIAGATATVTYNPSAAGSLGGYHLYLGCDEWVTKKNGDPTVAPGKFPYKGVIVAGQAITIPIGDHSQFEWLYVQAHADACKGTPTPGTPTPPVTLAPVTNAPVPVPTNPPVAPTNPPVAPTNPPVVPTNPPVPFTFPPQITLPPIKAQTGFTDPPSAGPACPIAMNGTVPSGSFECGCSEFSCDSPTSPWADKDYRFCGQCPSYLNGAYHFSCPHCASSGTEVTFGCPSDWESCDVFVQVYSNCATAQTDGGLAYNLASEGWTAGSCGPSFCLSFNDTCQSPPTTAVTQAGDTNIQWKMVLFHKQFAGGDQMAIPALATDPTMYFTFFVKQGHFCSNDKTTQGECEATPSVCKWNAGTNECFADICPPVVPPPGARPCCDVAPGVEAGDCSAGNTEITSVCDFNLPQC